MKRPEERAFSFKREYRQGVMGNPIVNYALTGTSKEFYLTANEKHVWASGDISFTSVDELDAFAKTLSQAWQEHEQLKRMAL